MSYMETKRPSWVAEGEQWSGDETQEQYEKAKKKLAPGASSVLGTPVVERYTDPYKLYSSYLNSGGKKSMTDWESAGRPNMTENAATPETESDYLKANYNAAKEPVDEDALKEKATSEMQDQLDSIDRYYANIIAEEETAGANREKLALGKEKAMQSRSGLLTSTFGASAMTNAENEISSFNKEKLNTIRSAQNLARQAIEQKIDDRSQEYIKAKNEKNDADIKAFFEAQQENIEANKKTWEGFANTTPLSLFKTSEFYEQAKGELGMNDAQFDLWYDSVSPDPEIISTQTTATPDGKTKITMFKRGLDGKITADVQTLDVALDSATEYGEPKILDNGAIMFVPKNFDGDTSKIKIMGGSGEYAKATTTKPESPLGILDIQRYQEAYPDAGIVAGDTETVANQKVQGLNQPKDYSETDLTSLANQAKTGKVSYEDAIAEIDNDLTVKNKDLAKQVFAKVYGKKVEQPVYGSGNFSKISIDDRISQLKTMSGAIAQSSSIKAQLLQDGYRAEDIKNATANVGEKILDSISKLIYKK